MASVAMNRPGIGGCALNAMKLLAAFTSFILALPYAA
jgi:hypothetical protein